MTSTVTKLIFAASALLIAVGSYVPIVFLLGEFGKLRFEWAVVWGNYISAAILIVGWIRVWSSEIRWTAKRRLFTFVITCSSLLLLTLAHISTFALTRYNRDVWMVFVAMFWCMLWIPSTAVIWRETPNERVERLKLLGINAIACPNCGYNMTGLKQAECPECGAKYTLDQLYAAMKDDGV